MANPYEQQDDPFKEESQPKSPAVGSPATTRTNSTSPAIVSVHNTVTTPFAQSQASYTTAEQPKQMRQSKDLSISSGGNTSQQGFYSGPSYSSVPPPPVMPVPQNSQMPLPQQQQQPQHPQQQQQQQQPEQIVPTSKFWTIEFYQQFFDVDTRLVLLRMSNTLVPINPPDFLMDRDWCNPAAQTPSYELQEAGVTLSRKPDLYGPFWICTTLWMTLGIVSNIMSKIAFTHDSSNKDKKWKYDFSMASVACIVMYLYCFGFGCFVWGLMKYKGLPVSLTDTLCLYGYSMFIFLPMAILCTIPVSAFQWVIVMLGGVWSTAYLLINFWHIWKTILNRAWFIGTVAVVGVFHMLLTLSFKFYFLNYKF
ncbi:protein YIPF2 [Trypanosoma theileri]|uniref:Protein YIPF n=1 Tax=Trypanosoma theileri TaxID=67003 RepID=A0A1X0P3E9_9TRYP|nr:protein YIPF2 [Trypanosoma theileri]ORC91079.1 protein YIPF2 [Trypanosoma theileri]